MAYDLGKLFIQIQSQMFSTPHLALVELSKNVKVERHTIEKAVKLATGKTFRKFRSDLMLNAAKRLLDTHPDQAIKEVAHNLGYNSQRSFSRFIKAMSGCSPKELRQSRTCQVDQTVDQLKNTA